MNAWRTPTARATAFHAIFVAGVVVLKSSTNALYLANCPPSGLAVLYVCVAGLVALATVLLAGPLSRYAPRALLLRGIWVFSGMVALLAGLCLAGVESALAVLYVAAELYATCLSILFWSTVNTWFDARTARRGYAVVSAGGMAGSMLGGVLTRFLVEALGAAGASILVAALTVTALPLLSVPAPATATRTVPPSLWSGASYLLGRSYPRVLAALVGGFAILTACVDYVFRLESAVRLTEPELATLFGDLNAGVGAAAIAYQLLLTHRVLERGGLFVFLGVVPALLAVFAGVAAVTGSFAVLVVVKGLEMAGAFSIQQSGIQLLYNPIPDHFRPAVRGFVDGLVKKGGLALAGVGLAVLSEGASAAVSPWLVLAVSVGCLVLLRALRGSYLAALDDKLRGSRPSVILPAVEVADRATRQALERTLYSPQGSAVLAALALLEKDPRFRPERHLEVLLTHEDPSVRLAALSLVSERPPPDVEFTLASILSLGERRPRAAAVRAFARCRPDRAVSALLPYLRDPDPGVACATIAVLLPRAEGRAAARARLGELFHPTAPPSPGQRRELARLLGELALEEALAHLPRHLEDPEESVRGVAMASASAHFARAAEAGDLEPVAPLVAAVQARLAVRSDRDRARDALAKLGDLVVPVLREGLDERRLPLAARLEIPRLLREIGTAAAAEALLFSNIRDHPALRYRIATALFQLRRRHPEIPMDRERADDACLRRLGAFTRYRPLCHELAAADASLPKGGAGRRAWDVLLRVTAERLLQNLEMALRLLGLHRGVERMDRVERLLAEAEQHALRGAGAAEIQSRRADALEVLDVALQGDALRAAVMEALEPLPPAPPPASISWREAQGLVESLGRSADPIIAGLARRVLTSEWSASLPWSPAASLHHSGRSVGGDPTDFEEVQSMNEDLLSRILVLEQVDFFAGLQIDDVAAIAGIAEERSAAPGEVLYREGEPGDSLIVIVRGRVLLSRSGHPVIELGSGESIGQVSFLDRGPRPTTAVVSDDPHGADLIVVGNDVLMDLVTDRPGLTRGLFAVLGKRLRKVIDSQGGATPAVR
jgi:HEAT repeat protein